MQELSFIIDIKKSGDSCKYFEGTKKYIATADIIDDEIVSYTEVTYANKPSRANVIAKPGDVIFAKMQNTIKVIVVDEETSNYIYSTGFYCIQDDRYLPEFLKCYFMSKAFNEKKDKNCNGATMKALSDEGFKKIKLPLISKEVQKQIIDEYLAISSSIKNKNKQISIFDELIKSQFIEMFDCIQTNKYKYEIAPLGKYMNVISDFNSNGGYEKLDTNVKMLDEPDYAWIVRTTDLESGNISDRKYVNQETYEMLSKSTLFGNELIMCKIGSAGKIYLMPITNKPATLARNAFLMRFDEERINMIYLYNMLSTLECKKDIESRVRGAVTKTITKDETRKISILVPPKPLQDQFAAIVEQIDKSKFIT